MTMSKLCAALAAATVTLALGSGARAAEVPGKGVGALGCVGSVVPGTDRVARPYAARNNCRVETARFSSGFCGRTLSTPKVWPWVGPAMSRRQAYDRALAASYGRDGC